MTHYVITLDWAIDEWEERASKIIGIAHSEEAAYKIFDCQLKAEQEFAEDWHMKVVENTPAYFEARNEKDNFVCLYIQKIDSKDDEKENDTMNELFERLMNGETEEEIVADFTSKLNESIHEKEAEEAKKNNKLEDTRELVTYLNTYFSKYYPKFNTTKITAEELIETLDLLLDSFQGLEDLFKLS